MPNAGRPISVLIGARLVPRGRLRCSLVELGEQSVVAIAISLPVVLLAAYLIGQLARWLLRGRVQLATATTIVLSVVGISAGMLVAGLVFDNVDPWSPRVLLLAVGLTTGILAIFAAVAA